MNFIKHQQAHIDKIYLYAKDPFKSKYQLLIQKWEKIGIEVLENPEAFIDYSETIDDIYKNLDDYNSTKKGRALRVFDDMITYIESKRKLVPIMIALFLTAM